MAMSTPSLFFIICCLLLQPHHSFSHSQSLLTITTTASHLCTTNDNKTSNPSPNPLYYTVVCFEGNVTQLHISGTLIPTLNYNYSSSHSLFATIAAALPTLKVLSLVSLGLHGPLPQNIAALSSLEILNLTSNNFIGSIPIELSSIKTLRTLILDHNHFTGILPNWVQTLPLLTTLSLSHNSFQGHLPRTVSQMDSLRVLKLSNNRFYGEVPKLNLLSNLQILDLEGNFLGPTFPKLSNKVVSIVLRRNNFRLNIPQNLTSFYQLRVLDVSNNAFVGPFDPKLLSLPSLTYIDISRNKLTGLMFQNMSCNPDLVFVNMSSNLLTGDVPECLGRLENVSYSHNCLSGSENTEQFPRPFCRVQALAVDIPHLGLRRHNRNKRHAPSEGVLTVIAVVIGFGLAALVILIVVANRLYKGNKLVTKPKTKWIKERFSTVSTGKQLLDAKHITETMKLGSRRLQAYRAFSLEELMDATNSFEPSALIAESSHGKVYRGKLADGTLVAVRTLEMRKRQNANSYTHHLEILAKLRHCHLVTALGHCFEWHPDEPNISKMHLVFEYLSNGTLRSFISGKRLNWVQRMAAAIGVTKGLQFLHTGISPGIFSNNLRIKDILLDQDFHAKISNYNLPLFRETKNINQFERSVGSRTRSSTKQRKDSGEKSDVYNLGTILLEVIVGRHIDSQEDVAVSRDILQVSLKADDKERRSIVDPAIHKEPTNESLRTLISICVKCLSTDPETRPSVEDVLWHLQFAAQIEESWKANSPIVL